MKKNYKKKQNQCLELKEHSSENVTKCILNGKVKSFTGQLG